MLRIIVDSGSSIKQEEKEKYGVDIIPLRIMLGEKEYLDGIDLSLDVFYDALINKKLFPKTSLPSLGDLDNLVQKYLNEGDEIVIVTISSGISGTYSAIKSMYLDEEKILVIDSKTAVGGVRIIVNEIKKYSNQPLKVIEEKIQELIPRIQVVAVPETLDYLHRGGRLNKMSYYLGSILSIKPLIGLYEGGVHVFSKVKGLAKAMKKMIESLINCDENYEIVPSYTYDKTNLEKMMEDTEPKYRKLMKVIDNLDPAIACHWGPNAFGYIFVSKEKIQKSI